MPNCPRCGEKYLIKTKCLNCGWDLKKDYETDEKIIEVQPQIVHSQASETKKSGIFGKIFGDFADGLMGTDYDETVLANNSAKMIEVEKVEIIKEDKKEN